MYFYPKVEINTMGAPLETTLCASKKTESNTVGTMNKKRTQTTTDHIERAAGIKVSH